MYYPLPNCNHIHCECSVCIDKCQWVAIFFPMQLFNGTHLLHIHSLPCQTPICQIATHLLSITKQKNIWLIGIITTDIPITSAFTFSMYRWYNGQWLRTRNHLAKFKFQLSLLLSYIYPGERYGFHSSPPSYGLNTHTWLAASLEKGKMEFKTVRKNILYSQEKRLWSSIYLTAINMIVIFRTNRNLEQTNTVGKQ